MKINPINYLIFAAFVLCLFSTMEARADILQNMEQKGDFAPLFPFLPTHDAPDNITNVRTWSGVDNQVAGTTGFIRTQGDIFVDETGRERRFIGTNIGMTGCFPEHEDAEKVARELTRYGINIVRMHYVSHRTPAEGYPVQDSFIEPVQLERFDYFFAKLKEQGIYVYFQLNIARKISGKNGFENAGKLPKYKNGIDNADSRMIQLQKRFHKEILNHVNPYTGIAYKDDPAISMLELANENSIVNVWLSGKKYNFAYITQPYKAQMIALWNEWLLDKYGSTDNLKQAWAKSAEGDGMELLPAGVMKNTEDANWKIQKNAGSSASWQYQQALRSDKLKGKYFAHVEVEKLAANKTVPKFFWPGISLKEKAPYCLYMKIRSSVPMAISVRFGQAKAPYKAAGLAGTARTTAEWKEFRFNFCSPIGDDDVRLALSNFEEGTVDIADVSLTNGMNYVFSRVQTLEDRNVDWPYDYNYYAPYQRAQDFTEFLYWVESNYFSDLRNNVKNNIRAMQPVTGTQLAYGFNQPQAGMDYCDIHGYWCHPDFKGGKWDWDNWYLRNSPIVNTKDVYSYDSPASVITDMANTRILGKPFTVSEYDHPNLNFYCAEGDIILAALGAFQNWSGLMQFAWILDTDYDRQHLNPMFDMCTAPQKLAHFPACYAMFVRKDVRKGSDALVFANPSSEARDIDLCTKGRSAKAHKDIDSKLLASLPMAIPCGRQVMEYPELFKEEGRIIIRTEEDVPENIRQAYKNRLMKSSTGELTWDWQDEKAGVFTVDTRNTKVFTGFVKGRTFLYRGMSLTPGKTRLGWMTLSMTLAEPFGNPRPSNVMRPGRYLLAATGVVQNTGEQIVPVKGNPGRISYGEDFGGSLGTSPVLCEGIPATLSFIGIGNRMKCYALDPDGNRKAEVPVSVKESGEAVLAISPEYQTVWYEVIIDEK